jgi:hypothetical protein
MIDTTLKSVFTLDPESQTYKPVAHNLGANEALERFNSEPSAKIVAQTERHRASNLGKCKACKNAAEELTAKHADSPGPERVDEETVAD